MPDLFLSRNNDLTDCYQPKQKILNEKFRNETKKKNSTKKSTKPIENGQS